MSRRMRKVAKYLLAKRALFCQIWIDHKSVLSLIPSYKFYIRENFSYQKLDNFFTIFKHRSFFGLICSFKCPGYQMFKESGTQSNDKGALKNYMTLTLILSWKNSSEDCNRETGTTISWTTCFFSYRSSIICGLVSFRREIFGGIVQPKRKRKTGLFPNGRIS